MSELMKGNSFQEMDGPGVDGVQESEPPFDSKSQFIERTTIRRPTTKFRS